MPHAEQTMRTCLVSGDAVATRAMIRFVVGPGDEVVPDLQERLPGRGIWVTADRTAVETAMSKRLFAKSAKAAVRAPIDLVDRVTELLRQRCLDTLGLARRAGLTVYGAERVRQALADGEVRVLIEAYDGSSGERDKLVSVAGERPVVDCFSRRELAGAFGRDDVAHAALKGGGLIDGFLRDSARFAAMRQRAGATHSA